ncbi:GNAT family N-acetyltransferase [Streptomyces sp. b94]|nr:GNAT family N-acetyltransferase [Streptomyces sp. b94]
MRTSRHDRHAEPPRGLRRGVREQVAYARVVTDRAAFAWLRDACVDPRYAPKGLGTALVGAVREHLLPDGMRRVLTAAHDALGVYEKLGFTALDRPDQWMAPAFGR